MMCSLATYSLRRMRQTRMLQNAIGLATATKVLSREKTRACFSLMDCVTDCGKSLRGIRMLLDRKHTDFQYDKKALNLMVYYILNYNMIVIKRWSVLILCGQIYANVN